MKLTKYTHSCLLAETPEAVAIFDPGNLSWDGGTFRLDTLSRLDEIVITHEHSDHFHPPFVEALKNKFPDAVIITTEPVAQQLMNAGMAMVTTESTVNTEIFSRGAHAPLEPLGSPPDHIAVHFRGRLTVAGDRHDIEESKEILAYPMVAPWGSAMSGAAMLARLKPAIAFPLHDWHWRDTARTAMYDRLAAQCKEYGTRFLKPVDGEPIEI